MISPQGTVLVTTLRYDPLTTANVGVRLPENAKFQTKSLELLVDTHPNIQSYLLCHPILTDWSPFARFLARQALVREMSVTEPHLHKRGGSFGRGHKSELEEKQSLAKQAKRRSTPEWHCFELAGGFAILVAIHC